MEEMKAINSTLMYDEWAVEVEIHELFELDQINLFKANDEREQLTQRFVSDYSTHATDELLRQVNKHAQNTSDESCAITVAILQVLSSRKVKSNIH